uniref:HicB-like antitoxin of toxin-antitoxin system domain-containing protein n=1 Tax=Candidatus Methanogaster sp. ANME-2c ERB4 TaxID=2759911 RepID=A0A7G9YEH6_9EURY|nr:hypothetical protein NIBJONLA_00027 [Methanosarcinales archaeon ANME-2c ERB4]
MSELVRVSEIRLVCFNPEDAPPPPLFLYKLPVAAYLTAARLTCDCACTARMGGGGGEDAQHLIRKIYITAGTSCLYNKLKSSREVYNVKRDFTVIIERDEDGIYVASVPELVGCHTQAETLDELRERITEAVQLYLGLSAVLCGQRNINNICQSGAQEGRIECRASVVIEMSRSVQEFITKIYL